MQEKRSLSELSNDLETIYPGSERKVGKLFALDFYLGLVNYDGGGANVRVGQISSIADTLETRISMLSSDEEPPSLSEVTLDARKQVGDPPQNPEDIYDGTDALFPYLRSAILRTKLIGNNLQEIGAGIIQRVQSLQTVKGDSTNGIYDREFKEIESYLRSLIGDRP